MNDKAAPVPKVIFVTDNTFIELTLTDLQPLFEAMRLAGVVELKGVRIERGLAGLRVKGLAA